MVQVQHTLLATAILLGLACGSDADATPTGSSGNGGHGTAGAGGTAGSAGSTGGTGGQAGQGDGGSSGMSGSSGAGSSGAGGSGGSGGSGGLAGSSGQGGASGSGGSGGPTDERHLLLTEVMPRGGGEFIEIFNPTDAIIALDNYYLSDDADYALLAGNQGAGPAPTISIDSGDFIARFPKGASIAPGQVIVVTLSTAQDFELQRGRAADYAITPSTDSTVPLLGVVFGDSHPNFANTGEAVALFYWDQKSDLIKDVDLVAVGTAGGTNMLSSKSGLSVDGPDSDAAASTYLNDAFTLPSQPTDPPQDRSTKRIALESGHETLSGGNGISGHDETTEDTSFTWDRTFSAPTPGEVPDALRGSNNR